MDLNLFFMRIMKEHLIFIEASLPPKNVNIIKEVDVLKNEATRLFEDIINLSNGLVSREVIDSEELVTKYTLPAERKTEFFTGIHIDDRLTAKEHSLVAFPGKIITPTILQNTRVINQKAIDLVISIIALKEKLRDDVLNCRVYFSSYVDLLEHITREAKFYLGMLMKLQNMNGIDTESELLEQEIFWNRIMGEHAKFIRGGLDPSEVELFEAANTIANSFDALNVEGENVKAQVGSLSELTKKSIEETLKMKDFNQKGAEGILACKIKSIILPLLADHTLRETNHYLRVLNTYKDIIKP
jgi:hypothetical protein